jgi:hypothetical protein
MHTAVATTGPLHYCATLAGTVTDVKDVRYLAHTSAVLSSSQVSARVCTFHVNVPFLMCQVHKQVIVQRVHKQAQRSHALGKGDFLPVA